MSASERHEVQYHRIASYLGDELGLDKDGPGNVNRRHDELRKDVEAIKHTLYGNGKMGMVTRQAIMWHAIWGLLLIIGFVLGQVFQQLFH